MFFSFQFKKMKSIFTLFLAKKIWKLQNIEIVENREEKHLEGISFRRLEIF